MTKTMAFTIY